MIKGFPKILLPLFLIFLCILLMFLSEFLGLDNENEGYLMLSLVTIIFYILLPLQVIFFIWQIFYKFWKKNRDSTPEV